MRIEIDPFLKLPLFSGHDPDQISVFLQDASTAFHSFHKGKIILSQGDGYESLYILVRGTCCGDMVDLSGKTIRVEDFHAPYAIALGILFSTNSILPVSIKARTDVEIVTVKRENLLQWCRRSERFLRNLVEEISNKVMFLSQRLYYMSFKSIRSKLAHYLLDLSGENQKKVRFHTTLEELSDYFGVARPSLSRVLIQLERENIIKHQKNDITILDRESLMESTR